VRKKARVRWSCPNNLCGEVSLHLRDNPRDHTWWPRTGAGNHTLDRRALEIYRNSVESAFAGRQAWMHRQPAIRAPCRPATTAPRGYSDCTFSAGTARRVAHETGVYGFFADEFRELGLHRTGSRVGHDRMRALFGSRPAQFRWLWPTPGRSHASFDRKPPARHLAWRSPPAPVVRLICEGQETCDSVAELRAPVHGKPATAPKNALETPDSQAN